MVRVPRFVLAADQIEVVVSSRRLVLWLVGACRTGTGTVVELLLGTNHLRLGATLEQWSGRPVEGMIARLHF